MAVRKPPYLLRVVAKNYRSLHDVDVRLGPLSVLVGPNGAGKSTLLDVVAFLGDSARRDLGPALERRGGIERLRYRKRGADPWVVVEVEAAVTVNSSASAPDDYELRFRAAPGKARADGSRALLREEQFTFKRTQGPGRRITLKGSDLRVSTGEDEERQESLFEGGLALATLPKLGPEQGGEEVDAVARLFESFRVFDVDVAKVRIPTALGAAGHRLSDDASNLGVYLQYLRDDHPDVFAAIQEDARRFVPGLEKIVFRSTSGAVEGLVTQLVERGLHGPTDLGEASFGSIRALALLALLHDPKPAKITCIEEIDHGLHPYVLDRLVDLLREASERTQLLIATHSPALVNRLRADELIVCERAEDGSSRIPAIDPEDVRLMEEALDGELQLGELWFTGALGGVPQA